MTNVNFTNPTYYSRVTYKSQITHHELRITNYASRIANMSLAWRQYYCYSYFFDIILKVLLFSLL